LQLVVVSQHLEHLLAYHLFVKAEKCQFHQRAVSLGYQISPQGVRMGNKKVDAVRSWQVPTTIKGLHQFWGFANIYCHFIRNFSTATSPLNSLLKDGPRRLVWSPAADEAFCLLKVHFKSAPLVKHPDPTIYFVVEVDASEVGVGEVLSQRQGYPQKLYPCAYYSKKLSLRRGITTSVIESSWR
jgi:hypothetical protein